MAGLVCAARARQLGATPVLLEKGDRPGGSMLLSSGVVWRYRTFERFRRECPGGDEALQRRVWERLDDALAWLEALGAPVVARSTGNPLTVGRRFDPRGLTEALVRIAGEPQLAAAATLQQALTRGQRPVVLATGGFQGDRALVARHISTEPLALRANPLSAGDGLRLAVDRGATLTIGLDEFYGRNMADVRLREQDFVPLAQLYARHARVLNENGEAFLRRPVSWSETDVVQATARQPGARAWYVLSANALAERVRDATVRDMVEAARAAGAPVVDADRLPFAAPRGGVVAVRVRAGITHTIGGLRIDARARVIGSDGSPLSGLYAAGVDAGGVATGGYASGLAQALVLGLTAAEDVCR